MRSGLFVLVCLLVATAGCGKTRGDDDDAAGDGDADADVDCSDADGDRYGVGADCLGDDCDDTNPDVHECDCGPNGDAHETGCACDALQPEVCYTGSDGTAGVGECRSGLRSCNDGVWGPCDGEVHDTDETCDYADNDCDGDIDEGVLGPCGDCSPDCQSIDYGPDATPFDPDPSNSSGIVGTPEGWLTLSQEAVTTHVIWIANSLDGTISKFDTRTREELARYRTGPLGTSSGLWSGNGDNPSRTSVNYFGDAYVANRAFSGQASATKILVSDCPDNGDGIVDTSSGGGDVLAWDVDNGPDDDCIAWNTPAGAAAGLGRSIASQVRQQLDGSSHEYVWFGIHSEQTYYEIDGDTGELTGVEAVLPGCTPYGAAIDADGNLWSSCYSYAAIARFDTYDPADNEVIAIPSSPFAYGITVDAEGHVWNSSNGIDRYRPEDQEWDRVDTGTFTAGIAADADGIVWANGDTGTVIRIDSNDPALPFTSIATARGGRGVAVDSDAYIWIINWSHAGSDGDVTVIDPADPENFDTLCCDSINNSYTYSDMSGFQLRNATAPRGTYEMIVEGCEAPEETDWVGIDIDGDFPAGTGVRAEVRTAETLPQLADATWVAVGAFPPDAPPFDVRAALVAAGVEPDYYLAVRITLESFSRDALPIVRALGIQRSCFNPFG